MTRAQQLRGDLRLDVEAVRLETERLRDLALHHLVTGLHVGDARAVEQVRDAGQHLVGENRQPRRGRPSRQKARSVHDARAAVENRLHQLGELRRIELEVGILDGDDRAGGPGETDPNRAALAAVLFGVNDAQLGPLHHLVEHLARAVRRSVVDDQDLARRRQIDRDQPLDHFRDCPRFVVHGNDDRDERVQWVQRSRRFIKG